MTPALALLLADEGLVPVHQLVGKCRSVISHWIRHGLRGHRLEAVKDGGAWMTSKAALARFRAKISGQWIETPAVVDPDLVRRVAAAREEIVRNGRRKK